MSENELHLSSLNAALSSRTYSVVNGHRLRTVEAYLAYKHDDDDIEEIHNFINPVRASRLSVLGQLRILARAHQFDLSSTPQASSTKLRGSEEKGKQPRGLLYARQDSQSLMTAGPRSAPQTPRVSECLGALEG